MKEKITEIVANNQALKIFSQKEYDRKEASWLHFFAKSGIKNFYREKTIIFILGEVVYCHCHAWNIIQLHDLRTLSIAPPEDFKNTMLKLVPQSSSASIERKRGNIGIKKKMLERFLFFGFHLLV